MCRRKSWERDWPISAGCWLTTPSAYTCCFKQKTAYEILRDWSSDVCSSDLAMPASSATQAVHGRQSGRRERGGGTPGGSSGCSRNEGGGTESGTVDIAADREGYGAGATQIGRASCRERVEFSVVARFFKKKL